MRRKKFRNFRFSIAGCSLLMAEGFSLAWTSFIEAIGKKKNFYFVILLILGHQKPAPGSALT
jgi:hypothetical protein